MAAIRNNALGMTFVALIVINFFPVIQSQILNVTSCSGGSNGNLDAQTTMTAQNSGNILYATQISNQIYTAGSIITVIFQPLSKHGTTFQEIILQARLISASVDTPSTPVGTFTLVNGEEIANNANFTILNCNSGAFRSTVATTNANSKILPVTFTYQAPDPGVGAIQFV
ncbi:hypothetical protein HOLleu_21164 [Holothuria leucospilota]|uniref:Reelin domain-containing protein n=1 Tax=Holothuria leucospilota TaxID=206669 RepID=A0A9Q1H6M4_HOLLE|nr:hypothetical protein HOLleu_21164 [Holothuria leucospilota]